MFKYCRLRKLASACSAIAVVMIAPAIGQTARNEDIANTYPGIAEAEHPAKSSAECKDLRANLKNLPDLDRRVDLWVAGRLNAIQTDGALWYMSLCLAPDIKVLCVTYQSNDMKVGDRIFAKGAYMRPDNDHILLDPCLADSSDQEEDGGPADK